MGNVVASEVYGRFRRLDLSEQVILAKPAKPELIAQFREGDPEKVKEALKRVERVKLRGRSLRGASFLRALLPGADLREGQLQGANLFRAKLQGADLRRAELQGAYLMVAQLQGAKLGRAQLQGASLFGAELQGANLDGAQLQGAYLLGADLQGANLEGAELQGANLRLAELQGANLRLAEMEGAILQSVELYGAIFAQRGTALVDLRSARWTPLEPRLLAQLLDLLGEMFADTEVRKAARDRACEPRPASAGPRVLPDRPGSGARAEMPAAVASCRGGSLPKRAFPGTGRARLPVFLDRAWPDSTSQSLARNQRAIRAGGTLRGIAG